MGKLILFDGAGFVTYFPCDQYLQMHCSQIMEELRTNGISIYQFPTDDEAVAEVNSRMNEQLPFAVVGSRDEIVVNGQKVRARKYPWGTVEGKGRRGCIGGRGMIYLIGIL